MNTQAVILVGGEGTRLNDHVRFDPAITVPKPLQEVGGKPFLSYLIRRLQGAGILDIILIVGYGKEHYVYMTDKYRVKLWDTQPDVNKAVLAYPSLERQFILLNGDCYPVMDWKILSESKGPIVPIKICDRDAGVAVIDKMDLISERVSVQDISSMRRVYPEVIIEGGLHIGTPQGLHRARQYFDMIVFGQ